MAGFMTANRFLLSFSLVAACAIGVRAADLGIFESHGDVGDNPKAGSAEYDDGSGEYRITGGGANIWAATDAFQFAWKRMSGDVTVTADVRFIGQGVVPHRKAVLMVRQSLDPGSAYADVALHGSGLTSLQYRPTAGAATQEVQSQLNGPVRIRIERRGNQFILFAGKPGGELTPSGPVTVALENPVYVGIGVCSHDANVLETTVFSNVTIRTAQSAARTRYRSRISIYDLKDKSVHVLYTADEVWEAPNWSRDGKFLLSNSGGHLYRIPVAGDAKPEEIDTGADLRCNNDHDYSHDGKWLAFSASTASSHGSLVFLANANGANRRQMTTVVPSYFHGWSPDGKWLALVVQQNGSFDLFRVAETGGEMERLTSNPGYDDGPDYSPDGKWIYFNSNRSGSWDIWRMPKDGAGAKDAKAQQVTKDELEDWFPHPSPDGKWLVFLSFPKGTSGHNDKLDVELRMMPMPRRKLGPVRIQVLAKLFGGQGTINVNSWAPDSKRFAFVSFEKLP
ncbi:MAG: TolB family protein [Bryobacteraceae bacterium]